MGHAEIGILAADSHLCVMDDRQRAQPQKVHLEQAQALDFHHIELGDRQAVIGGQRHILGSGVAGNDNARRMGRGVARHPLHLQRGADQLMHLTVRVIERLQIRADLQCLFQRHFKVSRNQLGHPIHILIAHTHNAADITHSGAGRHGTKGHNLGHVVTAILFVYVVNDLLTALIAEVNVKVRH